MNLVARMPAMDLYRCAAAPAAAEAAAGVAEAGVEMHWTPAHQNTPVSPAENYASYLTHPGHFTSS